jgi:predicted esterase
MTKQFAAVALAASVLLGGAQVASAQPPGPPAPGRGPFQFAPDPRVQERSYHFDDTNVDLQYSVFVSSKVDPRKKAPLVVTLHGLGVGHAFMLRGPALDLAEEGGYILVGPEGYNPRGWYGIPSTGRFAGPPPRPGAQPGQPGAQPGQPPAQPAQPAAQPGQPAAAAPPGPPRGPGPGGGNPFGPQPNDPPNLRELSEKDVMNVLALVREEFNVDDNRIYLMGHSMGGAGTLHLAVKYPDIWAAVGPIAPAAFELDPQSIAKVPRLPVVLVHGAADELVPVAVGQQWAAVMKNAGMTYEYHELPGVTHGPVINDAQPLIYAFFAKHAKETQRQRRRSRSND